jgi:flagellar hook-associated protein 2
MGVRVNTGSGIDPQLVNKLVELERQPIKKLETRKKDLEDERKQFREFTQLVSELGQSLNSLRNPSDFRRLKVDSSNPDIAEATVDNLAVPGSYEIEIRHMAKSQKLLTEGFPDKDETPVGYGYMTIELDDGRRFDVDIDPDASTLQDVAKQINEANAGCKAIILNTKESLENTELDSYRLLVISEKSGKAGKVFIDPDTTYLEFKEQMTGRNLEMLFEDVSIFDDDNSVEGLIPGLVINAKRAEPGTKITMKIGYDIDKTFESLETFVTNYNKVADFIDKQFQVNPSTNKAGTLSKDNTLKQLQRSLQSSLQYQGNGKFRNLAEIGITSDPKTGALKIDASKVKKALADDYDSVAELFVQTEKGAGFGTRMSDTVRNAQNQQSGVLGSKEREYKRTLDSFDDDIARKERAAGQRAEGIKRKFAALEGLINGMNSQGQAIAARLGVQSGPMPGLS